MAEHRDILVIGGGPVGACCALWLAEAGATVTLIEKELEVCPPASGAHANCGLLVPSDVEPLASPGALGRGLGWLFDSSSPFFIAPRPSPALLRWLWLFRAAATPDRARAAGPVLRALHTASADLHDALAGRRVTATAADSGATIGERWRFHHDGIVQAYEAEAAMDEAVQARAAENALGVRSHLMDPNEVRKRFPGARGELAGAVFYPDDGHLDPLLFTREVVAMAETAGATVRCGTEAFALEPAGAGAVRTRTTKGEIVADQVVLAAGAWSPALTRGLGVSLPIEPAKGYSVDVERPADFPDMPLYMGDAHCVLTPLGDGLRLGSTLELAGWDMRIRPKRVAGLRRATERLLGIPADGPVRQIWRGPRPVTPDGLPVVGRLRRQPRLLLATGHCMLGLSLAPVTAQLIAEVAGGSPPSLDLAPLTVDRFG